MALYHKHRPRTFSSVIGQEHIIETLMNQVRLGKTAHAYLFSGPRGVGKTTTARILAKSLNCREKKPKEPEPCDACAVCRDIADGRSIDVIEMDAASHTGVENVRENIINNVEFKPTSSPYKVFIIDEAHMLSGSSFNALLKTLEEPPPYAVFILATTEQQKIPATIISRCQRYDFKKIPFDVMKRHLEAVCAEEGASVDPDVLDRIVRKSDGGARDAVSLLDQILATGEKRITSGLASAVLPLSPIEDTLAFVRACVSRDAAAAIAILHRMAETGASFLQFADDCVELARAMLILRAGAPLPPLSLDLSADNERALAELSRAKTARELVAFADILLSRRAEMRGSPLPQLPLELAAIELADGLGIMEKKNETIPDEKKTLDSGLKDNRNIENIKNIEAGSTAATPKPNNPTIQSSNSPATVFTLEEVRARWKDFLNEIEKTSASLSLILKSAELRAVEGATVIIAVAFRFHKDKLLDISTRRQVEGILSPLLVAPAVIDVVVEARETSEDAHAPDLQALANLVGGDVL